MENIQPLLAMGDIAGGALFLWLLISGSLLLVAVGLLALFLWNRSLVAIVVPCILVPVANIYTISFFPLVWQAFVYSPPKNDLEDVHLIYWCRILSVIWVLLMVTAVACFVRVIQKWKSNTGIQNAA
jgi:hypothetical protein